MLLRYLLGLVNLVTGESLRILVTVGRKFSTFYELEKNKFDRYLHILIVYTIVIVLKLNYIKSLPRNLFVTVKFPNPQHLSSGVVK